MGLYRNIAGQQVGVINDYYFVRPDLNEGGGGGTIYPTGGGIVRDERTNVPVQSFDPVAASLPIPALQAVTTDQPIVYYDPWYADTPQISTVPVPDPETVYEVRKDEPVIPIQQIDPNTAVHTMQVTSTAAVDNGPDKKNILPLLTLAFLYANMIAGEGFLGKYQRIAFAGGLGLLYYQFNKRADQVPAP